MNLEFATVENLKQPVGGLLPSIIEESDHVMGGLLGEVWPDLLPSGRWYSEVLANSTMKDNPEIQRVLDGDTYLCVTYSHDSIWRLIHLKKYNKDFNVSERFIGIGSGTARGRGNSKSTVAKWSATNGFLYQEDCPMPNTLDAVYAPITDLDRANGKQNLKFYTFGYKWLPDNSIASIQAGLRKSPVQVDVQSYVTNSKGYVINSGGDYIHEVAIVEDMGDFWCVWDSESYQFVKFEKSYIFGSPMIHNVTQSNLNDLIAPFEGKQVKGSKSTIYLIKDAKKKPYLDKLTFYADGGLYGADGKSYLDISDSLLALVELDSPVDIMETVKWPMFRDEYPLIKTLSEPQNVIKLKEIEDQYQQVANHYDSGTTQTGPVAQSSQTTPTTWDKLLNFFK